MKQFTLVAVFLSALLLFAGPRAVATDLNLSCFYCHNGNYPYGARRETSCLTCHGPGGISSLRAFGHAGLDCYDCHETHGGAINWLGGTNRAQLRADVDKSGAHSNSSQPRTYPLPVIVTPEENRAKVVFESRGTGVGEGTLHSFADGDQDANGVFDGICEACHQSFLHQDQHHIGETCTLCHLHRKGFGVPAAGR